MSSSSVSGNQLLGVFKQRMRGLPRTPREVNYSLQMLSVMRSMGWQRSVRQGRAIDRDGSPHPWYTYAALEWLTPRIRCTHRVFEFGGGYSTVWYGEHAAEVISVEHDRLWFDQVKTMVGSNVTLLHRDAPGDDSTSEADSAYCQAIEPYPPKSFDLIAIDGIERVRCACVAPPHLRDEGIIVFDNSDRPGCRPAIEHLHGQGFGRIDFYGFFAGFGMRGCTSVFSRRFDSAWTAEDIPLRWQGS